MTDKHRKTDNISVLYNRLIRPPDIVCRWTYVLRGILSSFFFSFFFRRLISELAERKATKIGHMVGSKCNLKTHVQNLGYPLPLQIGGPKTTFWGRLCNLTATLTAYIFGKKHDIDNRSSQNVMNFGPQMTSNSNAIYPPSANSAFCFIVRLRRRRSANGTPPNFATSDGKSP